MGGTVGSTDSSARHHLREGRKYRTADVLYKGHFLATNLLLRSQLVKTGQNCSSQSLSQASPLCNLGELLCSFFLSQVHRTVKHLHLQNKTCWNNLENLRHTTFVENMVLGQLILLLAGHTFISFFSFFLLRVAGGEEELLSAIHPTGLIPSSPRLATGAHHLPLFFSRPRLPSSVNACGQQVGSTLSAFTARSHLEQGSKIHSQISPV